MEFLLLLQMRLEQFLERVLLLRTCPAKRDAKFTLQAVRRGDRNRLNPLEEAFDGGFALVFAAEGVVAGEHKRGVVGVAAEHRAVIASVNAADAAADHEADGGGIHVLMRSAISRQRARG